MFTKEWQWVALDPNIYHPLSINPLDYPAIIEHEKIHLAQQRKIGKFKWFVKYTTSKNFRFQQELEPIAVELSHIPQEQRMPLAVKYAGYLAGPEYSRAAKSPDLALEEIMSKAAEMGIEVEAGECVE